MAIEIRESTYRDTADLARLRWAWRSEGRASTEKEEEFISEFSEWWEWRGDCLALVATDEDNIIAMGFLALVRRVPEPGALDRRSGDVQSVYVRSEYRNRGIGSLLVRELIERGMKAGCIRITVHSGSRAIPIYERLGFEHSERLMMYPPAN